MLAFAWDNLSYHPRLLHGPATLSSLEWNIFQPLAYSLIGISTRIKHIGCTCSLQYNNSQFFASCLLGLLAIILFQGCVSSVRRCMLSITVTTDEDSEHVDIAEEGNFKLAKTRKALKLKRSSWLSRTFWILWTEPVANRDSVTWWFELIAEYLWRHKIRVQKA